MAGKTLTGALVACVVGLASAPSAWGGRYHVYTCRTPSGHSAPTDGWSGSKTGAVSFDYTEDTCGRGGALIAALGDGAPHPVNTEATWKFSPPTGAMLAGATLWRAGDTAGGVSSNSFYELLLAGPQETAFFSQCAAEFKCAGVGDFARPLSTTNLVVVPAAHLGANLFVTAFCGGISNFECQGGVGDASGYAAVVYLYAADLVVEENGQPSVASVSGELASAGAVSGTSDIAFTAADSGAGVYKAVFAVDGQVVQATVPNENGGRCRDVGETADGLAAFLYTQPCPASVSADVSFDTTALSNGAHHLVVSVIDAAGNAAPVLDRQITVANPVAAIHVPRGAVNGTNASEQATLTARWKSTAKIRATTGYGRPPAILGRLIDQTGRAIAGASIDVTITPAYAGARLVAIAGPRTGPDGSFTVQLPRGISSSSLRIAYRSHVDDPLPVATRTLSLAVRAGIALSVSPHTTSVGQSIFFRGRLLGGSIPAGGKQLVLEARSPGSGWIEFRVIRTDRRGRFRSSYRFKFAGPASYSFRAVSNSEADYPFATGASSVVGVRER